MNENKAKKAAHKILVEHKLSKVSLDNIIFLIEGFGYEIIDYSKSQNSPGVQHLITTNGLEDLVRLNYAFIYICGESKYVFLDEDLLNNDKLYALAHELGHICCGHIETGSFLHGTFSQEHEANEFAHYLLSPPITNVIYAWVYGHKTATGIIAALIVLGIVSIPVISYVNSKVYHDYYYVTDGGLHYHLENCFYIQGKDAHRMTEEEYASGNYTPCKICIR